MKMKKVKMKKEGWIMLGILAIAVVLFIVGVLPTLREERTQAEKGDPNDVSEDTQKSVIIGSGRPERGAKNPRYTLVEFGDYQCATCARSAPILEDLMKSHRDLRLIFRHAPIATGHQVARVASRAAEAARLQNKYWEMHDLLYARQDSWVQSEDPRSGLASVAAAAGCDVKQFQSDMKTRAQEFDTTITADLDAAMSCSVTATPSFFLITPRRTWAAVGPGGLKKLLRNSKYWE